jgi:hypothetical protein
MSEEIAQYDGLVNEELLARWNDMALPVEERNRLVKVMQKRLLLPGSESVYPSEFMREWESTTGAYPDIADPEFLQKLLARREFADSYQTSWQKERSPCEATDEFELTPVQRFIANFMSPRTPYRSALLYHATGVGKTCSAIQVAEQFLSVFPNRQVIILAPRTIRGGYLTQIFDVDRVVIGEGDEPNTTSQCTGTTYLELANCLYERDKDVIKNKVLYRIRRRYKVLGYLAFALEIDGKDGILKKIPARFTGQAREQEERRLLNREYGGKLIIIDEAHNLRDAADEPDKEVESPGGAAQQTEEAEGKVLTPIIRKLFDRTEDMRLLLMTATPMYNSYTDIFFLFDLILRNEKKALITIQDIFPTGVPNEAWMESAGARLLGLLARSYVSHMRGENPQLFPIRMSPLNVPQLANYPANNPRGQPINDSSFIEHLPIVPVTFTADALAAQVELLGGLPPGEGGIGTFALGPIIQAGTLIVPEVDGATLAQRTRSDALALIFNRNKLGGELVWRAKTEGGAAWLALPALSTYAPKIAAAIERIQSATGVCFVFSRFVNMGVVPIALALEANGYTPYKRMGGRLGNGIQSPGGRQCALCSRREANHEGAEHGFVPAKYVLLTGDEEISPRNKDMIDDSRASNNKDGGIIKVIVGSEVASEGVDLRFVREIHILESWYHLNKIEQVVGRGIRTCSHALLAPELRNCTVYLYAGAMPEADGRESGDLYSYRYAYNKGRQMGVVSRVIKMHAIDCNLNFNANVIRGVAEQIQQMDAQNNPRSIDINDQPFTNTCDYLETCLDKCVPTIKVDRAAASQISYDEYTGRFLDAQLRKTVAGMFEIRPWYREDDFRNNLGDIPDSAKNYLLHTIKNNPNFKVRSGGRDGYIIYRNGYYLFQPFMFKTTDIPVSLRTARLPVRVDNYSPEYVQAIQAAFGMGAGAGAGGAGAGEEAPVAGPTSGKLLQLFDQLGNWAASLGAADAAAPSGIVNWFANVDRVNMIRWFATALRATAFDKKAQVLAKIATEMAYDEECSPEDQLRLFMDAGARPLLAQVASNQLLRLNGRDIFVFVDIMNGQLRYIYDDGIDVNPSDKETLEGKLVEESVEERKARNPNFGLKADSSTTGSPYGFIAAKRGLSFVFKTGTPPAPGGKVGTGSECAIVSNMVDHARLVGLLGDQLVTVPTVGALGLDATKVGTKYEFQKYMIRDGNFISEGIILREHPDIAATRIINANRVCTLLDVVLRFMDEIGVRGRRYFYRAVDAVYTGHKGTFRIKK